MKFHWMLVAALALAGCGKAPAAALVAAPALDVPAGVVANNSASIGGTASGGAIVSNHASRVAPTVSLLASVPAALEPDDLPPAADAVPMPAPGVDDPPALAALSYEEPPSYQVGDRIPYGVAVVTRMAHSTTIYWRTEVPTRGVIDYGRVWGFDKEGYTASFEDPIAKTDHQITLTDLRRFTAYQFRVTAITALGLRFPEAERKFRTKFWSWR